MCVVDPHKKNHLNEVVECSDKKITRRSLQFNECMKFIKNITWDIIDINIHKICVDKDFKKFPASFFPS